MKTLKKGNILKEIVFKKLLFFLNEINYINKEIKIDTRLKPFLYLNENNFLFENIISNLKDIIFFSNTKNFTNHFNFKNLEKSFLFICEKETFLKNLIINNLGQILNEKTNLFKNKIFEKFKINKDNFQIMISSMELGTLFSLLLEMKKEERTFSNLFKKKNFDILDRVLLKGFKMNLFSLFKDKWDSFFEFLIYFKIYRNFVFHPGGFQISYLIGVEETIKFYNNLILQSGGISQITIKKNKNEEMKIMFQSIDFLNHLLKNLKFIENLVPKEK